ncbi:FtsK/SpoIIIE domain-containing protein [Curtobacterium citreum]
MVRNVVEQIPLAHLRIDVYDPTLRRTLAPFGRLRTGRAEAFPTPMSTTDQLARCLDDLIQHTQHTAETLSRVGHRTLSAHWDERGVPEGEFRLLVLLGYPHGGNAELNSKLRALAGAAGNGVLILALGDRGADDQDTKFYGSDFHHRLLSIFVGDGSIEVDGIASGAALTPTSNPSDADIQRLVDTVITNNKDVRGPTIPLADLIDLSPTGIWAGDASTGLDVTIGRESSDNLDLSLRSENPPVPNALIGGAVGQGKSNLLLDIIYALTAKYSPDELELLLLDFKEGLEFARFATDVNGQNWLPHASLIGLESSRSFGLAVLEHLRDEMKARSALFKSAGVSNYDAYRIAGNSAKRIVLVVDEFQMLFDGDDAITEQAGNLLSQLSRQLRASGIHIVFASQTLSGISGLVSRQDAIFGQFATRIALRNSAAESETILARGNRAAADLRYRGEVIINDNFGDDPDRNRRGVTAYAEPAFTKQLQKTLWKRAGAADAPRPYVFSSTTAIPWEAHGRTTLGADDLTLDIGRAVSVTERAATVTMKADAGQALAVLGQTNDTTAAVTAAALVSMVKANPTHPVVVVDAETAPGREMPEWVRVLGLAVTTNGGSLRYVDRTEALTYVQQELRAVKDTSLAILGGHLIRGLDDYVDEPDSDSYETYSGKEVLEKVIGNGPVDGVNTVITVPTSDLLDDVLGVNHTGIGAYAMVGLSEAAMQGITSIYPTAKPDEEPRFVLHNRNVGGNPTVVVPFAPLTDEEGITL